MKKVIYGGREYEVPDWTRWMATDEDGEVFVFTEKPDVYEGVWLRGEIHALETICARVRPKDSLGEIERGDWKDSLVKIGADDNHENH